MKSSLLIGAEQLSEPQGRGISSNKDKDLTQSLFENLETDKVVENHFFKDVCRILNTETPAALILDEKRKIVFSNFDTCGFFGTKSAVAVGNNGTVFSKDAISQNFLLKILGNNKGKKPFIRLGVKSFLIPKSDGWPMAALMFEDQLGLPQFSRLGLDERKHVTLLMRNSGDVHPAGSKRLRSLFGQSEWTKLNTGINTVGDEDPY